MATKNLNRNPLGRKRVAAAMKNKDGRSHKSAAHRKAISEGLKRHHAEKKKAKASELRKGRKAFKENNPWGAHGDKKDKREHAEAQRAVAKLLPAAKSEQERGYRYANPHHALRDAGYTLHPKKGWHKPKNK